MKTDSILTNKVVVGLLASLCCIFWGSTFPCTKMGYALLQVGSGDSAAQLLISGYRFIIAGGMIVLWNSLRRKKLMFPRGGHEWRVVLLIGLINLLQYICFVIGIAHTSGVHGSITNAVNPFLMILFAAFLFHQEKMSLRKVLGCVAGFGGVILINLGGLGQGGGFSLIGEGLILVSSSWFALATVVTKHYSKTVDPMIISGCQLFFSSFAMVALGLAGGGELYPSAGGYGIIVYMGVSAGIAYALWAILMQKNPVSSVSVYNFMNPVAGVLLSMVLLQESGDTALWQAFAALALVCLGIYIINRPEKANA